MKKLEKTFKPHGAHWVGDGFPVRTLFDYQEDAALNSPFLLLDYAGPHMFEPTKSRRGIGQHPHRGFETVTIVYEGEVAHRDSLGNEGAIGPGDVQWMIAASGILHEEYHSAAFAETGGPFRMVQLWVNLPRKDKMGAPGYQAILDADIPRIALPNQAGRLRLIAGSFGDVRGPARTFSPIDLWDISLNPGAECVLAIPAGHTTLVAVLDGELRLAGDTVLREAELARFSRDGSELVLGSQSAARLLVLAGQPLNEPVVGRGPFVMSNEQEIRDAFNDLRSGRFALHQPRANG